MGAAIVHALVRSGWKRQISVQFSTPVQTITILSPILDMVAQEDLSNHFSDHEQLWLPHLYFFTLQMQFSARSLSRGSR